MNLQEDYVSFEIAKLLKEKGFSENTICKYAGEGGITEKWYDDYRERVVRFDCKEGYLIEPSIEPKDQYEIIGDTISAPTLQMTCKWLRKVHNLHIWVDYSNFDFNDKLPYLWNIRQTKIEGDYWGGTYHKSYEEAAEDAIKYCLDNLI